MINDDGLAEPSELIANDVSALKTGTPLIDIPRSLSVYTDKRIDDQNFQSIGEIIDYTPGVNTSQGEGHRDSVVFRGVRSTADFYIDGLRDDVQYYRSLYNVERVEILRGPSALHFGRGGTGGILNRALKRPEMTDAFGEYGVSVDTFGATYADFDYNAPLFFHDSFENGKGGKSIVQEPWAALRLNAFYEYLDNHRDFTMEIVTASIRRWHLISARTHAWTSRMNSTITSDSLIGESRPDRTEAPSKRWPERFSEIRIRIFLIFVHTRFARI